MPYFTPADAQVAAEFGDRLRSLRQQANLTQGELAEKAGMSRAYLAALERGLSSATKAPPRPTRPVLAALARALDLSLDQLVKPQTQLAIPIPFEAPPAPALPVLGTAPGPAPGAEGPGWQPPEADGVVRVGEIEDETLGLQVGDEVMVRWTSPNDPVPEGLCLLEARGQWSWARVAHIGKQPFLSAPDGSYRPMPKGTRAIAVAIALVRSLS